MSHRLSVWNFIMYSLLDFRMCALRRRRAAYLAERAESAVLSGGRIRQSNARVTRRNRSDSRPRKPVFMCDMSVRMCWFKIGQTDYVGPNMFVQFQKRMREMAKSMRITRR
jgi:hypothetical protein